MPSTRSLAAALLLALLPACGRAQSRPAAAPAETQYWRLPTGSRVALIHVPRTGTTARAPIIFLHGGPGAYVVGHFPEAKAWWQTLAGLGHDVYLYDQAGGGFSARLPDPRQYTVERHVQDLEAIRRRIGAGRIVLIGDSWGATLAAQYIAAHPDAVERVVFTSPGSVDLSEWVDEPAPPTPRMSPDMLEWVRAHRGPAAFARCRELDRRLTRDVAGAHAFAGDAEMDALFDAYINDRIMPTTVRDARKLRSTMHGMGFWVQTMISWDQLAHPRHVHTDLGRFTRPVLVLHGDSDYLPPGMAAQYAATFPAARAVEIPGAGHLLWVDQPEVYAREILRFLRQPA